MFKGVSKKILAVFIVVLLVAVLLLSIYFLSQYKPLDAVSLTVDDLKDEGFKEYDKQHITEPYIATYGLFEGWNILEKYHVRFNKNDSCFIIYDMGRLESVEKCKEFLSIIKNTSSYGDYDFIEVESSVIGDESYIGEDNTTVFGSNVTIYFIVFRKGDVVVAFLSSDLAFEDSLYYVRIMESRL